MLFLLGQFKQTCHNIDRVQFLTAQSTNNGVKHEQGANGVGKGQIKGARRREDLAIEIALDNGPTIGGDNELGMLLL